MCQFKILCNDIYLPQLSADWLVRRVISVDLLYGRLPELHSHQTNGLLGNGVLHLVKTEKQGVQC